MPKDGSNARKRSAHDLAKAEGIPYTEALKRLDRGRLLVSRPDKMLSSSTPLVGHSSAVSSIAFHPSGKLLASGGDVTARLWDLATRNGTQQISQGTSVLSVAFSPDGRTLATGYANGTVSLWVTGTGDTFILAGGIGPVQSVVFSPDGKLLGTSSDDPGGPTIRLWDLATRRAVTTLPRVGGYGHAMAFHPGGTILASSGDMAGAAYLWKLDGEHLTTLSGHEGGISTVAFAPDGRRLATGSIDSTIRIWDTATGELSAVLTPHAHYVIAVAFSPDGRNLATASVDSTVRLWDAATGKSTTTLFGHRDFVNSIAFSPDGRTLASGSMDSTIRLWGVS